MFRIEYALLRVLTTLLRPLGFRASSRLGAFIGGLAYWPFGIRADRVLRHIRAAFPSFDEARVRTVARDSYRNLGIVALEAVKLSRMSREDVLAVFADSPDYARVDAAWKQGRGVILVSGHLGNWELSMAYMSARGLPVDAIAMHLANPHVDGFVTRTRERLGGRVLFADDSVRAIPKSLKDGRAIGFLSDQGAKGLAATFVDFFGRPARTPRGAAVFALRARLPLLFVAALREPDGRYQLHAQEIPLPDTGEREHDVDETVRRYTVVLEDYVRRYPGQYFWQHRRWKRQPPDTPPHLREP